MVYNTRGGCSHGSVYILLWPATTHDPFTLLPANVVNANVFSFYIQSSPDCSTAEIIDYNINMSVPRYTSVTENEATWTLGLLYTGLTQDDVGGLAYILNQTNICVESLDSFTLPAAGNTNALIRTAPRPGVEKITFVPHPVDASGNFLVATNLFTDSYFTNGALATQAIQRVTPQPDFIFSAKDFGMIYEDGELYTPYPCQLTDTSKWINNSALNGNPGGNGPGIIRSPV